MTTSQLPLAQAILLDQWEHISEELRSDILTEFNKGFTRIVPYKDGPFNRLGLSDGENTLFFSGEHTADFNALMDAAQNAYRATHFSTDIASNTRLLLDDIIHDAQIADNIMICYAIMEGLDTAVIDYLQHAERSPFTHCDISDTSMAEFVKSDSLKNGVCDALQFIIDAKLADKKGDAETVIINDLISNPQIMVDRIGTDAYNAIKQKIGTRQKVKF
jgi:hypothetical protein